jgi:hypothetical protein
MRFSGHETFSIREGWLYKGLKALSETPGFFNDKFPADKLGVGNNMGKSIKHWLLATGLAHRDGGNGKKRGSEIVISDFGQLVLDNDPYFNTIGTWCFIHVNLANSEETTASWSWFLSNCVDSVFVRTDALEQFRRWSQFSASRLPSIVTLQKDLNCFLSTYAQKVPQEKSDAEEATDCPLWELDLLTYYRGSHRFRANRSTKKIPAHVIGYSLATHSNPEDKRKFEETTFSEAASQIGGPGKAFLMGPSELYDSVNIAQDEVPKKLLSIGSQAGERTIKYKKLTQLEWAQSYYESRGK